MTGLFFLSTASIVDICGLILATSASYYYVRVNTELNSTSRPDWYYIPNSHFLHFMNRIQSKSFVVKRCIMTVDIRMCVSFVHSFLLTLCLHCLHCCLPFLLPLLFVVCSWYIDSYPTYCYHHVMLICTLLLVLFSFIKQLRIKSVCAVML